MSMSTSNPAPSSSPSPSSSSFDSPLKPSIRGSNTPSPTPAPPPPSISRLWRPSAQRNLRNQWSKLASYRQDWAASSSDGRSHANSLVNAYLSQRYMPMRELGVLKNMPDIRKKACKKLIKQQEFHKGELLSSYQNMVVAVTNMVTASRSMKCFSKVTSNGLVQFSSDADDKKDTGDGGGIPVFTFWSIAVFENLAQELVHMFELELGLKRLLVVELVSTACDMPEVGGLCWSEEFYPGEFRDLAACGLYSEETNELLPPRGEGLKSDVPSTQPDHQLYRETLEVYLIAWLAEVSIDIYRVNEIFDVVGEEIHAKFS